MYQNERNCMNLTHFFLMNALITSFSQAMHIENSLTLIKFKKEKKSIYEWIRDDQKKEFGNTAIITTTTNQPPFKKTNSVKTLQLKEFDLIAAGHAFYCSNIKKKNNITYGAIIINPQQYHFKSDIAEKICMNIRNSYVKKQLTKNLTETVTLDTHDTKELNLSSEKKRKLNVKKTSSFSSI